MIRNPLMCDDTRATANAVSALGAKLDYGAEGWRVESAGKPTQPKTSIDCRESGVTLRFTIPISSILSADVVLRASERLIQRPLQPLIEAMNQLGIRIDIKGIEVIVHAASAEGGKVQLPGNVSSQFISGLLLVGPLLAKGLEVRVTTPLESKGYVSLTIDVMKQHSVVVESSADMSRLRVTSDQTYRPAEHIIPGDYSSAAFLMSAAAVTGSEMSVLGLSQETDDPDSAILPILSRMGATTAFSSDGLKVEAQQLKAAKVNISDCPDLGPIITVLGCSAEGETEITGAARLRYKESDRLAAIASELNTLGARVMETDRGLLVSGPCHLSGGGVESHVDHRIAMALAVAALTARGDITIQDAQCVNKSYPRFFDDMRALGVEASER